jgi:16S rRNA (guanine527-N7)-methyltransferase
LRLGDPSCAPWVDIGSGAGLPGIVIACFGIGPVILVEPRRLRAEFLGRVVDSLGLDAQVIQAKAQQVNGSFATITARAVASLQELLKISSHLSTGKSLFLFPKGKSAHSELLDVQKTWQGSFHVEPSITDPDSSIIVASNVRPKST